MKRGKGIKGRTDRSSGIEILMADTFAKINPTEYLSMYDKVYNPTLSSRPRSSLRFFDVLRVCPGLVPPA
jgi:hypothetical protein